MEGGCCTVNRRGVNKGAGLLLLPSHARQQQQLTGKCYLEYAECSPPPPLLLLHQQTANVNAGAVTQVYKQQTEGPHQRLSLKDNRCCPPPHLPCLHSSPARASTPTLPLRPERCPLLSGVGGERGRSQCHPGSSASKYIVWCFLRTVKFPSSTVMEHLSPVIMGPRSLWVKFLIRVPQLCG